MIVALSVTSERGVCTIANSFFVSESRQASQTADKSAYFDLKKGFSESLLAPWISACALARAPASAAIDSDFCMVAPFALAVALGYHALLCSLSLRFASRLT